MEQLDKAIRAKLKDCLRWARMRCEAYGGPAPQVTPLWLARLWQRQRGRCYWTGVPLELNGPNGATLDRINPVRGYQRDNVVLATRRANAAKGDMTVREFRDLCRLVLARRTNV
jgi:hypothetical protein